MVFIPYGDSGSLYVIHDSSNDSNGEIFLNVDLVRIIGDHDSASSTSVLNHDSIVTLLLDSEYTIYGESQLTKASGKTFITSAEEDTTPSQVWIG